MRIAVVSPGMLPVLGKSRSSVEIAIGEVARRLAARHSVSVYGRARRAGTLTLPSGVAVHNCDGQKYVRWLIGKLRSERPDIVQVENRPQLVDALRRGLGPSAVIVLGLHSLTYIRPGARGRRSICATLESADAIIVNSDWLAARVRKLCPKIARRLRRVHLGVDGDRFRPADSAEAAALRAEVRARLGLPGDAKVVLFVGRLIAQKGAHCLLRALPAVRRAAGDVRLLIVGGARCGGSARTAYVRRLLRAVRAARGAAAMAGYVPHRQLPAYYAAADVVVTPSLGPEALCLVNLEAMASGLPVVSTHNGGISEAVVDGRTGVLVSPRRIGAELAPAIVTALARAAELGRNGRQRVATLFTWERTAAAYEGIYERLLRERASGRRER